MIIIVVVVVVVVIIITTVWNKNMLIKRWSIYQIRWDTIVIFIPQSTKTLQLKKGLDLYMQKITYSRNYILIAMIAAWHSICILIKKLHLHFVELSKTANINS